MQIAINGKKNNTQTETHLRELVSFFMRYAEAQTAAEMQGERWPNLHEVSRVDGYRGIAWEAEGEMSYYRGGRERTRDGKERSCMGLDARAGSLL